MTRQRIAITGSSGLIGGALSAYLRERGDVVIRLVRRHAVPPFEARADVDDPQLLAESLSSCDAVVNLAGAGIAERRWSPTYKETLRGSRVGTTSALVEALALLDRPIRFVSGSASGIYGDRGEEVLTEASDPGEGFLPRLCTDWESAALAAQSAGHRVACVRTGLVVSSQGGAFPQLAHATRLGAGGRLGSGRQWWSAVSLRDEVRAIAHLIDNPEVCGPVNVANPVAYRQQDVAAALGRSLMRPAVLPTPAAALRLALGEFSQEVLASRRIKPDVLERSGFSWLDANLDQLLDRVAADITGRAIR